jgi:hypothetical protein
MQAANSNTTFKNTPHSHEQSRLENAVYLIFNEVHA